MKIKILLSAILAVFTAIVYSQPLLPLMGYENNPILQPGEDGQWDEGIVFTANGIYDDSTFYLFYSGGTNPFNQPIAIGLATSENGFDFTRETIETPLLEGDGMGFDAWSVSDPVVAQEGDNWTLYYGGAESSSTFIPKAIGKATSANVDGPYTRMDNPILEIGNFSEWDSYFIFPSSIISTDTGYLLYYWAGDNYPTGFWSIGLAMSEDGLNWTKYDDPTTTNPPFAESDPILQPGQSGEWDGSALDGCAVLKTNDGYEMIYGGWSDTHGGALGYATSEDGILWTKQEEYNPIYTWQDDPYANENLYYAIEIPTVILNESIYYVYYDHGPSVGEIGMTTAVSLDNVIFVPGDQLTIQSGIDAAIDGNVVLVDEGTYYENIRFKGKAITVTSRYFQDGDSSHIVNTIIDGSMPSDPDSAAAVMFVHGEDITSVINGFTITGGSGVMNHEFGVKSGGGVFSYNSGCKIKSNIISGNLVESDSGGGAGICCFMSEGDYWTVIERNIIRNNTSLSDGFSAFGGGISVLTNSIISDNIIEYNTCTNLYGGVDGGGIEIEQWIGLSTSNTIENNIIRHNTLSGKKTFGAGISILGAHDISIANNEISNNSCEAQEGAWGGGIYGYLVNNTYLNNNLISSNSSEAGTAQAGGGGINLLKCGKIEIDDNYVNYNTVSSKSGSNTWGGGIMIDKATDTVLISNNDVENNEVGSMESGHGGGICFYGATDIAAFLNSNYITDNFSDYRGGGLYTRNTYRMFIENNIFRGNDGNLEGGAIMFYESANRLSLDTDSHPFIANNTFFNNNASIGGAVYSLPELATPLIINSIFWINSATTGEDIYNMSTNDIVLYNNDIDVSMIDSPWVGADNIFIDPMFMDDSLHLNWGSQCVNAGIETLEYDGEWYFSPENDIDGEDRPFDGTLTDIGADEAQWYYVSIDESISKKNSLVNIYPNPFTSSTTIEYLSSNSGALKIVFCNQFGEHVDIIEKSLHEGLNRIIWTPDKLSSGVYYFNLQVGEEVVSGKVVMVK